MARDSPAGIPLPLIGPILIFVAAFLSLFSALRYSAELIVKFKVLRHQKLTSLETIDFAGNKLTNLPVEMEKLKKLKRLNLDRNEFKDMPEVLTSFIRPKPTDKRQKTGFSKIFQSGFKQISLLHCSAYHITITNHYFKKVRYAHKQLYL